MKIVFTLESFFPSHRAGTEIYVLNLCKYFKKQGWEVHVLIATSTEQKDYLYEGIPVHTFDIPANPDPKELNGIIQPRGIEYFLDRVQKIDPDVVHFHSFGRAINSFHLRAVKALGIRTVFTPHLGSLFCIKGNMRLYEKQNCNGLVDKDRCMQCLLVSRGNSKGFSYISAKGINLFTAVPYLKEQIPSSFYQAKHRKQELQRIGKYSDIIFSIAPWIQNAFIANNITTARLIPQGISEVFFEGTSAESCRDLKDRINFVFIGRMHPSKGFHLLKEVWDKLDEKKVQLHIITNPSGGETNYFNSFKNWGERRDNVIWNEAFSQKMVAEYLQKMDALILPSLSNEVAPLVILEAASKKIPVISSDYIAMKDMVNDKVNGLLFENGNEKDLLTQILKLVYDRELLKSLKKGISTPHCMMEIAAIVEKEIGSCLNDKHLEKTVEA
ncbi:MAG: glycosyltransferase family 4 protein [Candidatus Bathyarchaeota archaeon]|nr:glycosyltransferase family 4 protein [Candidatus Bathyarchaeota archaeon]